MKDSGLQHEAEKIAAEGSDLAGHAEPDLDVSKRLIVGSEFFKSSGTKVS